ncbi:MAG: DUF2520 domain-containing protein [Bdellovibrionales bacterium]|jgi:predicted short-subunit dehydrogenase-like oxidoreductase (DUF2520 family)
MGKATSFPYLIIGSGRAATHFKHYLALKGIPYADWNRKEYTEDELQECLARATHVLLLIKDSAIREFRDQHLQNFKGTVLHFSGSLTVEGIESFHPLMTFGPSLYDLKFYEKIYFAAQSKERFRKCFPKLANPVFELKAENKAFYHALCVMSGNFPQILWHECLLAFDELNIPTAALSLYLHKNLENFMANPKQSLTGPLARKDWQTIQNNIDALPDRLKPLYSAFVDFYLPNGGKS